MLAFRSPAVNAHLWPAALLAYRLHQENEQLLLGNPPIEYRLDIDKLELERLSRELPQKTQILKVGDIDVGKIPENARGALSAVSSVMQTGDVIAIGVALEDFFDALRKSNPKSASGVIATNWIVKSPGELIMALHTHPSLKSHFTAPGQSIVLAMAFHELTPREYVLRYDSIRAAVILAAPSPTDAEKTRMQPLSARAALEISRAKFPEPRQSIFTRFCDLIDAAAASGNFGDVDHGFLDFFRRLTLAFRDDASPLDPSVARLLTVFDNDANAAAVPAAIAGLIELKKRDQDLDEGLLMTVLENFCAGIWPNFLRADHIASLFNLTAESARIIAGSFIKLLSLIHPEEAKIYLLSNSSHRDWLDSHRSDSPDLVDALLARVKEPSSGRF